MEDVLSIHAIKTILLFVAIAVTLPLMLNFFQQYLAYLALGPGGTPATVLGFLKVKVLGLFAVSNPYLPATLPTKSGCKSGYLKENGLQARTGERPEVRGIAPQRQVTQKVTKAIFDRLAANIELVASRNENLTVGTWVRPFPKTQAQLQLPQLRS